ncbi:hypothetical protein JOL62DRAFT_553302 [Phyllosticta paracitricarpa]|uniref:Transcription regulator Rua1 C-terminal domain-containing protein n=1 Tax=Phyllosticta paracitricarpa TaxID=2016321 RepID=A0ABR1NL95_9PEZI
MEFNASSHYVPAHGSPYVFVQDPSRNANQIMYPYGTGSVQQSTAQPHISEPASRPYQPSSTWSVSQPDIMAVAAASNRSSISGTSWTSAQSLDVPSTAGQRPASMNGPVYHPRYSWQSNQSTSGDYYSRPVMDTDSWGQKACIMDIPNMDQDMHDLNPAGYAGGDENNPIIDLRQCADASSTNYLQNSRQRLSSASVSTSSTGFMPEMGTCEDYSEPDSVSYAASDMENWGNYDPTSNLLSPLTSPQRNDPVRTVSRGKTSPGPQPSQGVIRSSPYGMDTNRQNRWSIAGPTSTPSLAPAGRKVQDRYSTMYSQRLNPHKSYHSMPAWPQQVMNMQQPGMLSSQQQQLPSTHGPYFSSPGGRIQLDAPRPLPSQSFYGLLQSNDHHSGCSAHFADFSEPPNLYQSLEQQPCDPPESDMHPSDPDMVPKEQEFRFEGDLYTPRWVRGHGNKREGWCGLCRPGRWLVLKNSAYWYDKSFTHGVSANTGGAFQGPKETRRAEGNLDVWEGLCGTCGEWVALVSSKKKGTTWFRHAYKCHAHPKAKDGPKRRRETLAQLSNQNVSAVPVAQPSSTGSASSRPESSRDVGDMKHEPQQHQHPSLNTSFAGHHGHHPQFDSAVDMSDLRNSNHNSPSPHHHHQQNHQAYADLVGMQGGSGVGGAGSPSGGSRQLNQSGYPSSWAGMI